MHRYSSHSYSSRSSLLGNVKHLAILVVGFVALVGVAFVTFANAAWWRVPENGAEEVAITVQEGERFGSVTNKLEYAGIANNFWLRVYARAFDDDTIYPGNYIFVRGMSYKSVMTELHGHDLDVTRLTIPEGYSLVQMGERIHSKFPDISVEDWTSVTSSTGELASDPFVVSAGKPMGVDLEGYLFPDTYEFAIDATAKDIAETMLRTMERRILSIGEVTGDAEGMSTHEILTLASIVEKEVRMADTMKNVADIFLKRLDIGMPLQSDATINYIIDGDNPSPTYADLEVVSPYNTYRNPGLPPGPIAAPGLNALNAVIHPIHNEYYYFLTTDEGDIYYAETYNKHLENKARYL